MNCDRVLGGKVVNVIERVGVPIGVVKDLRGLTPTSALGTAWSVAHDPQNHPGCRWQTERLASDERAGSTKRAGSAEGLRRVVPSQLSFRPLWLGWRRSSRAFCDLAILRMMSSGSRAAVLAVRSRAPRFSSSISAAKPFCTGGEKFPQRAAQGFPGREICRDPLSPDAKLTGDFDNAIEGVRIQWSHAASCLYEKFIVL